jgi:hypothetical protein
MSGPLDILRQLYPQARVTSTRRDPNSALGRANPHSYHNIGQAFDVAPIPGVAFPDYVNSLKSGGVNVVEALDEASHPKAWTTGPNWHVAFGDQSVAPRKPRSLADLGDFNQPSPVGLNAQPMHPARTLADLQTPQVAAQKHGLFGKGGDGWKILGILGDSYLGANGHQGNYIPQLLHQREADQAMAFDREKLNASSICSGRRRWSRRNTFRTLKAWASMGRSKASGAPAAGCGEPDQRLDPAGRRRTCRAPPSKDRRQDLLQHRRRMVRGERVDARS